ncbi:MAG TPA: polyprenyl synthetase family protein [Streptosporangiaceae bacterium]|nr:polyprenyl synthetase family protein [Streptosporangiaceae bacterium]
MAGTDADLTRIRAEVGAALDDFIGRQCGSLASISGDLVPCADAITELMVGGKRLRPAFCYWGWRALGGADGPPIFAAAAALELLHASALVHDDVMDASDTRRGQPAVHRRFAAQHAAAGWRGSADSFGSGAAILVGDLLLAWTDEMLRASGLPPAAVRRGLAVLDSMRTEVFAGQFLDLVAQASSASAVDAAMVVVTYKSAKYTVERPLHLGAALASAPGQVGSERGRHPDRGGSRGKGHPGPGSRRNGGMAVNHAFSGYGIPVGIAFQLRDDILGVFGDPARTGKPVSDDLREGKRTVLLAIARERSGHRQSRVLDRSVGDPGLSEDTADEVRAVITGTGALAECEQLIDGYVKEGLSALDAAPITAEAKDALADLAIAATARKD